MERDAGKPPQQRERQRRPEKISKQGQLRELAHAAHTLWLTASKSERYGLPDWRLALEIEEQVGGREAAMVWFQSVVGTLNQDQLHALRWMLMDRTRELLSGLGDPARLADLYRNLEQGALAEKRRVQEITAARSDHLGVEANTYVDLAEEILREHDSGLSGKALNYLLAQKIVDRSLPARSGASLYEYFKKAKQRIAK